MSSKFLLCLRSVGVLLAGELVAAFGAFVAFVAISGGVLRAEEAAQTQAGTPPQPGAPAADRSVELFRAGVRELLTQNCVKCHGGEKTSGELDLTTREGLLKGGSQGPAVTAGDASKSLLLRLIKHAEEPHMPEKQPRLPDESIAKFSAWIDAGAMYDGPLPGASGPAIAKPIPPERRDFWSFRRLARPEPPAVTHAEWPKNNVDRFVLAKQEAAGLAPSAEVDRRRLIRRVSLDLIGLPPTPEEVEAFAGDSAPDAYDRLVDRLLASPHYGERWARHWLDLARFAESHGYEQDDDRPNAYYYRDFVIRALNDDMPYDQFLRWQIAGDELAPDDPEAWLATGFLAAGTHATQITANQAEKERYDELDDIAATVGTSMLGLTIGCARCHDHKYDPIAQHDYYRFVANFTATVRSNYDLNLNPTATRLAHETWQREHAPLVAALERFEAEELPARVDRYIAGNPQPLEVPWLTLDLETPKSAGGANWARQADGSWLASGPNVDHDTFTLVARGMHGVLTSVRLEALADASLPHHGPGRADNGNFALTDFRVTVGPGDGKQPASACALKNPRATFEQNGLPVAATIDSDQNSGWAVDPQFGKNQAAAFEFEQPLAIEPDAVLTCTLKFNNNNRHAIGRVRLSVAIASEPPPIDGDALPYAQVAGVKAALAKPAGQRTPEDLTALVACYRQRDADWLKLRRAVDEHREPKPTLSNVLVCSENVPALRLRTQGPDFYPDTQFLKRGDLAQKTGPAPAGFLRVLSDINVNDDAWRSSGATAGLSSSAEPAQRSTTLLDKPAVAPADSGLKQQASAPSRTSGRRATLSRWLTDVDHGAGHLAARVIVNRLWRHHFGRGLVATPSDFGSQGERPTHPELLDYLASEAVRGGWRLKSLHKLLVTSAAYRQTSDADANVAHADPENKLLTRFARRRLEAEALRDSMLGVSGQLDRRMFGPGSLDEQQKRRTIYFTIKRSQLIPWMVSFDCPEPLQGVGLRSTTTVAPQALALMNNATVLACARGFAKTLCEPTPGQNAEQLLAERVDRAYRIALSRPADDQERALAATFIVAQTARYGSAGAQQAEQAAWTDFCHALLSLNEFAYVD